MALALILATMGVCRAAPSALTIGTQLEPTGLDPTATASSATAQVLFPAVYEGLVRLVEDNRIDPSLAASWDLSADAKTYRFHLRQGVRFHDDAPLNADAVRFSLERAIAPGSANPLKNELSVIDRVETPDQFSVVVILKEPRSGFLALLGRPAAAILSPGSAERDAALAIGTGPFRFVEWRRGQAIILKRNADYWGTPARLGQVTYRFISDPTAALAALHAGDIDAFDAFPAPESIAALNQDPRFVVRTGLSQGKVILALNNARAPFNDPRVRRALSHAVDRKAILDGAMFGHGQVIGSHFPPQDPDYVDLTGLYPHDPAKARALLAEAGYPNGFHVTLKLPPLPYARRSGEIIAAQLAEAGIRVDLVNLEWMTWLDQVFTHRDYDMSIVAHIEPMDYDIYGRDDYYFGYRNPHLQSVLRDLDAATAPERRSALVKDVQRIIAEDAVNVFLFELPVFVVHSRKVADLIRLTPVQLVDLARAHVDAGGTATSSGAGTSSRWWGVGLAGLTALLTVWIAWKAGLVYVLRRLGGLIPVLIVASLAIFLVLQVASGDQAQFLLGMTGTPEQLADLRHKLGLDASAAERYLRWVAGILRGDFGISQNYQVPVASLILERLAVSAPLAVYALVLTAALSLAVGVLSALSRDGWTDRVLSALSQIALAIPDFWLGMMLVLICAETLHWTAAGGFPGWAQGLGGGLRALTLPAIALAIPQAAILGRVLRGELLDLLDEDFIVAARARGMSGGRAVLAHALPNALVPTLTVLGVQAAFLLAGAIIVETVFDLPGLGRLLFQAVSQRDLAVVQGGVLVLVAAVVGISALVDLACAALDPRWVGRHTR